MRSRRERLAVIALGLALAAGACKRDDDGGAAGFAAQAVDATDVVGSEGALLATFVDDADPTGTPEAAAELAAGRAATTWSPAGCVTATQDGAQVDVVLDDCTGPFGLAHVTGTVSVAYSLAPGGGIAADAMSSDLSVNDASYDLVAHAVYSISGALRRLAVTTSGAGVGPRGTSFTREGVYALAWDEGAACMSLDGTWTTTVGVRAWSTLVSALTRCRGGCPASGGTLRYQGGAAGVVLTVSFEGGERASWESSTGARGSIELVCG